MGGPGSGDRPHNEIELRRKTIQKAWSLTHERLNSEDVKKYDTAEALVVKDMVSKQAVNMDATIQVSQEEQALLSKYIDRNRLASN